MMLDKQSQIASDQIESDDVDCVRDLNTGDRASIANRIKRELLNVMAVVSQA